MSKSDLKARQGVLLVKRTKYDLWRRAFSTIMVHPSPFELGWQFSDMLHKIGREDFNSEVSIGYVQSQEFDVVVEPQNTAMLNL